MVWTGNGQNIGPIALGATLYLTADIRYHEAQQAQAAGLSLIVLSQLASEVLIGACGADFSQTKLDCPVRLSASRTTPWEVSRP
jgi:putative NIF3 family GTP cyclohydrolase 1 type 2